MKKIRFFTVPAILLLVMAFTSCGTKPVANTVVDTGNTQIVSIDTKDIRRIMLGTYYISSEDNYDEEILLDFEQKLLFLADVSECNISREELDKEKNILLENSIFEAERQNVALLEYSGLAGYRVPYYEENSWKSNPEDPVYYRTVANDRVLIRAMVEYLADFWELEADAKAVEELVQSGLSNDDAEEIALKNAVMDYSVSNSKITFGGRSFQKLFFKTKILKLFATDTGLGHEVYVISEDGYAAVYTTAEEIWQINSALEPYEGERIWGTTSSVSVSHVFGDEGWEYLIERTGGGKLGVLKFERWVSAEGVDRDAFISIYGVEPKIHP